VILTMGLEVFADLILIAFVLYLVFDAGNQRFR